MLPSQPIKQLFTKEILIDVWQIPLQLQRTISELFTNKCLWERTHQKLVWIFSDKIVVNAFKLSVPPLNSFNLAATIVCLDVVPTCRHYTWTTIQHARSCYACCVRGLYVSLEIIFWYWTLQSLNFVDRFRLFLIHVVFVFWVFETFDMIAEVWRRIVFILFNFRVESHFCWICLLCYLSISAGDWKGRIILHNFSKTKIN